jgi:hypothetical protein
MLLLATRSLSVVRLFNRRVPEQQVMRCAVPNHYNSALRKVMLEDLKAHGGKSC